MCDLDRVWIVYHSDCYSICPDTNTGGVSILGTFADETDATDFRNQQDADNLDCIFIQSSTWQARKLAQDNPPGIRNDLYFAVEILDSCYKSVGFMDNDGKVSPIVFWIHENQVARLGNIVISQKMYPTFVATKTFRELTPEEYQQTILE
jgi:hypothetical protein